MTEASKSTTMRTITNRETVIILDRLAELAGTTTRKFVVQYLRAALTRMPQK